MHIKRAHHITFQVEFFHQLSTYPPEKEPKKNSRCRGDRKHPNQQTGFLPKI